MVFNSYTFIVFFIVVLALHYMPLPWKVKKVNLLLASYLFYAAWNPVFILLLWMSTVIDYFVGKALYHQENPLKKKWLLVISLIGNLGMLCFFKYGGFLLENFVSIVNMMGMDYHPAKPNIILPAGISFYTFTTLCYTIDMYKKESAPVDNLLDFSLFVTFFPHLVAGPIVRPPQLVPQFATEKQANGIQMARGLWLLSMGLFMKVFIADSLLAQPANDVFNAALVPMHSLDAWAGVLAFAGQIFFDFGGYSTCAIGVAMCLGFTLPENFRYPYAAVGFSDFWKRWHITLSAWLRDYLYIPLGGNRYGESRMYLSLMLTMLIGGLWHGANWTFVVWGGLHGLFLVVEKWMSKIKIKVHIPTLVLSLITFFFVLITWVFFRAETFSKAGTLLQSMFTFSGQGKAVLNYLSIAKVFTIMPLTLLCHWYMRDRNLIEWLSSKPSWQIAAIWTFLLSLLIMSQESTSSFIYFQF